MAFTVTPTSGASPYTLSASFDTTKYIDGVNYVASLRTSASEGSCPSIGEESPLTPTQLEVLLTTGSVVTNVGVSPGFCRAFTLTISQVSDSIVVDTSTVFVDNI